MIQTIIAWFIKGQWLETALLRLFQTFELIKHLAYLASILMLVGLAVLSIGTLIYLFMEAIGIELISFQFLYDITEKVVNNKTAWAAFIVLVANITFIHRNHANDIQQEALNLQKQRWHYERDKLRDEHHTHQSVKNKHKINKALL